MAALPPETVYFSIYDFILPHKEKIFAFLQHLVGRRPNNIAARRRADAFDVTPHCGGHLADEQLGP
jgi:hypothetical protein